jgi:hypothetical protein
MRFSTKITDIFASHIFNVFLDEIGDVYSTGKNTVIFLLIKYGQLGLEPFSETPKRIFFYKNVKKLFVNEFIIYAFTDDQIYFMGDMVYLLLK